MDPVIVQAVEASLRLIAAIAPGLIAQLTSSETDEEGIAKARKAIGAIRSRPAGSALDEHEAAITGAAPAPTVATLAELHTLRALRVEIERTHIVHVRDGRPVLIARSQTGG